MSFFRRCLFVLLAISVASCATQSRSVSTLDVISPDPDRIRFQGKGAGAGMVLMSSMGPMGIAIGVAIDEGIAKDIDSAARESGFDIKNILVRTFQVAGIGSKLNTLTIQRYGFISRSGDNDPVAPQLHVYVVRNDGSSLSVKYPGDFDDEAILLTPLELVKTDGDAVIQSFDSAAVAVFKRMKLLL